MTLLNHIPALVRMAPVSVLKSMFFSIVDPKTLAFALVVSLILVLSRAMESTGQMKRLLEKFRGLVQSPRLNLVIFPALIGLLPMPGGAVFSAPMVKELGGDSKLTNAQLSFVNYWFRHIWEYWWPMYPGVLLATMMADISLPVFVAMMIPLTLTAMGLGTISLKGLGEVKPEKIKRTRPPFGPFLKELTPILIVIVPGLLLGTLLSRNFPRFSAAKEAGLIASLILSVSWLWHENRMPAADMAGIVIDRKMVDISYMVIAILVFKGILGDSEAVRGISNEMMKLHIPLFLVAVLLPFMVGLFTGITIAFVGSTFPILISLVQAQGQAEFMPAYIMVGLSCGFAGVLLSPLHLCLLLSNAYFETKLSPVYRSLWLPTLLMMAASMGYFWVIRGFYL